MMFVGVWNVIEGERIFLLTIHVHKDAFFIKVNITGL